MPALTAPPTRRYRVNEIFYSLQGEGLRAGEPSVFVRFSGCNLRCLAATHGFDCDTEFVSGRTLTGAEILAEVKRLAPQARWIVLTGGEPGLQVDEPLVDRLHAAGFKLAIETNGTQDVSGLGLDWITLSPKVAEHAVKQLEATEIKYVRGLGQGIPKPRAKAQHYLISPAFDGPQVSPDTLAWCVELCKQNPPWRLSLQLHKFLGVR